MSFKKGDKKPEGSGRKKGTKNKATVFGEQAIQNIVDKYNESGLLESDLASLDPRERIKAIISLLPFIVSKKQQSTIDASVSPDQAVFDKLAELAKEYC